jgi:hypothetical protein
VSLFPHPSCVSGPRKNPAVARELCLRNVRRLILENTSLSRLEVYRKKIRNEIENHEKKHRGLI